MRVVKAIVLASLLVAPTVLAGCLTSVEGTKDWWSNQGNLVVRVGSLPEDGVGQRLTDFQSVLFGVTSVVATPVGEVVPLAGAIFTPPMGLDLRKRLDEGEMLTVLKREHIPTKTVERVDVKLVFFEAVLANGTKIPLCSFDPAERAKQPRPCFAMPETATFTLNKAHNPPRMQRAKTMTMDFPLAIVHNPDKNEYFPQARFADEEAPVTFT